MLAVVASEGRLLVVAGLVWLSPRRLLVQRRAADARFGAGMLELPGGKIEPGEAPERALARELVEEWGPAAAQLEICAIAHALHHVYPPPGPEVVLLVYHVDARAWADTWRDAAHASAGEELLAFAIDELPVDEFLPADRSFVAALARGEHRPPH
jgi:8-oxo-dGTP diphosphatase